MNNERIIDTNREGHPKKEVLNFDEATYSNLSRPEYFPVTVRIPKKISLVSNYISGHPYFVDEENILWYSSETNVMKKNLSTDDSAINVATASSIDPNAVAIDYVLKTNTDTNGDYNILVFLNVGPGNTGGKIYLSTDKAITWTKVLDLVDLGILSHFRPSNVWYEKFGAKEFIFAASYGINNANDDSAENGVWRSLDNGLTWSKILTLPLVNSGSNNHVHAICVSKSNGWLWVTHGDGLNRGILYSHDALYADEPTITELSKGSFGQGGWQPSGVVTTALGAFFGTDTEAGLPNGILGYDLPDRTFIDKLGFRAQILHDDGMVHITRRGAQINGSEAYMPIHIGTDATKIMVTGDAGFSWHVAATIKFGPFEKGMSNPDQEGYVHGPFWKFKVDEWDDVTKWVKGRFAEKVGYI